MNLIQNEILRMSRGHQLRDINDWGKVYVDALTLSLRSRLSVELSYALTTLAILSTMRSQGQDTGFLIGQCEELLEELLDLLEEVAFPNGFDSSGTRTTDEDNDSKELITNRRLINMAHEEITSPFAPELRKQGQHNPELPGPAQRRGDIIRLVLNLFRNLSAITDNQPILGQNGVLIDLLLGISAVDQTSTPKPLSDALSLPDLIIARKDIINILVNICGFIPLSSASTEHTVRAKRIFDLVASYLVDPSDTLPPTAWIVQHVPAAGIGTSVRPPLLPDAALEVFTRVAQPDSNRKVLGHAIPEAWLWKLFESLVYRLPNAEPDFIRLSRDEFWMGYLEKIVLGMYSLAFLMPTVLKERAKEDRALCFARVVLRFVKRFMKQPELRVHNAPCARRAIEALKLVDDGQDAFEITQSNGGPPLMFGVGYGEMDDKGVEVGSGLLGGQQEDVLWSVMLQREMDEVMFSELESLARVEIPAH